MRRVEARGVCWWSPRARFMMARSTCWACMDSNRVTGIIKVIDQCRYRFARQSEVIRSWYIDHYRLERQNQSEETDESRREEEQADCSEGDSGFRAKVWSDEADGEQPGYDGLFDLGGRAGVPFAFVDCLTYSYLGWTTFCSGFSGFVFFALAVKRQDSTRILSAFALPPLQFIRLLQLIRSPKESSISSETSLMVQFPLFRITTTSSSSSSPSGSSTSTMLTALRFLFRTSDSRSSFSSQNSSSMISFSMFRRSSCKSMNSSWYLLMLRMLS